MEALDETAVTTAEQPEADELYLKNQRLYVTMHRELETCTEDLLKLQLTILMRFNDVLKKNLELRALGKRVKVAEANVSKFLEESGGEWDGLDPVTKEN